MKDIKNMTPEELLGVVVAYKVRSTNIRFKAHQEILYRFAVLEKALELRADRTISVWEFGSGKMPTDNERNSKKKEVIQHFMSKAKAELEKADETIDGK